MKGIKEEEIKKIIINLKAKDCTVSKMVTEKKNGLPSKDRKGLKDSNKSFRNRTIKKEAKEKIGRKEYEKK